MADIRRLNMTGQVAYVAQLMIVKLHDKGCYSEIGVSILKCILTFSRIIAWTTWLAR